MKHILFLFVVISFFFSCIKTSDENLVMVRVHNQTTIDFDSVYAIGNSFGLLRPGNYSGYKIYNEGYNLPGATIMISGKLIYAGFGFCGTPPLPMLSSGKYTLAIFKDSITYSGYNARFVKE